MFSSAPFPLIDADNPGGRCGLCRNHYDITGIYGFVLSPAGNCRNNIITVPFFTNTMYIKTCTCWEFISLSSVINAMFCDTVCYDIPRYIDRYLKSIRVIRTKSGNTFVIKIAACHSKNRTQGAAILKSFANIIGTGKISGSKGGTNFPVNPVFRGPCNFGPSNKGLSFTVKRRDIGWRAGISI